MKQPLIHPQDFAELQHLLPPAFGEIVQLIGLENAFVLVKNYGGTSFKIGKNKNRYGKILHFALAEVIGEDAACAVEKHMAGLRELNIPKCEAVLREMRNRQIRREFDELTSREPPYRMGVMLAAQNLARAYNLTQRQIYNIVNNPPPEPSAQAELWAA